jgi:hypothetical protein
MQLECRSRLTVGPEEEALGKKSDSKIVQEINGGTIKSEDLVSRDAWSYICKVRGRNFSKVDAKAWEDLCARRGYLLYRRNARGF